MSRIQPIPGYERYYGITKRGRIYSYRSGRFLKRTLRPDGYLKINLFQKARLIHHLVALTFIGPRPQGLVVNHRDGVKSNNHYRNLEYTTIGGNNQHAHDMGLVSSQSEKLRGNTRAAKLNKETVKHIRDEFLDPSKPTKRSLQRKYNLSITQIRRILNYEAWPE